MRLGLLCSVVPLGNFGANAQSAPPPQPPHLAAGTMSARVYENEAAGVKFGIPVGWSGSIPSGDESTVDPLHPDSPLSRCSQKLLSIERDQAKRPGFKSVSLLIAMNPGCFPSATFPQSNDRAAVTTFANELVTIFRGTVFIPPSGVDFGGEHKSQHEFVYLQGSGYRGAQSDEDERKVHVNSLISVTDSKGYWVAWLTLADDAAKKQLMGSNIQFWEP